MNREELLAKNYLESLNLSSIIYEPDGNIPPDFLVDNHIAVEVTRLNEHIKVQGVLKRLDDDSSSITAFIKNVLHDFESDLQGVNFWVTIHIKRPFGNRKTVKRKLRELLSSIESREAVLGQREWYVSDGLSISFMEATPCSTKPVFMLGGISEHDIGGYVYEDVSKNVGYCVESKSSKIQPYKSKYQEWWLILIDSIAYGCYPEYIDNFKATFEKGSFNKVIVLEAIHGQYVFEI
ncbi:hypothetical protein MOV00_004214 [Vibrio vulnificus]|nr:hypothetical protein [Vibrio vulnificus]